MIRAVDSRSCRNPCVGYLKHYMDSQNIKPYMFATRSKSPIVFHDFCWMSCKFRICSATPGSSESLAPKPTSQIWIPNPPSPSYNSHWSLCTGAHSKTAGNDLQRRCCTGVGPVSLQKLDGRSLDVERSFCSNFGFRNAVRTC